MLWTLVGVLALSGHLALANFFPFHGGPFFPHSQHREQGRPNGLSAVGLASDNENNLVAAFVLNVENTRRRRPTNLGFNAPFALGPAFPGPGRFPPGPGQETPRISASIEVMSNVDTDMDVIITERSFVGESCREENFGPGFDPRRRAIGGLQNTFGLNNGFPGIGGVGGGFGNPLPALPGFPFGGNPFGGNPFGLNQFGFNQGRNRDPPRGIIASFSIAAGERRVIETDNVPGGFTIDNMKGRGVVGCVEADSDEEGRAVCEGENSILFCGTLGVDNTQRTLDDVLS